MPKIGETRKIIKWVCKQCSCELKDDNRAVSQFGPEGRPARHSWLCDNYGRLGHPYCGGTLEAEHCHRVPVYE